MKKTKTVRLCSEAVFGWSISDVCASRALVFDAYCNETEAPEVQTQLMCEQAKL